MEVYVAAFLIGIAGSLHCIGMCGPIALALPVKKQGLPAKLIGRLVYNLGRTGTYAMLGLLAGALGKVFVLAGLQQVLSIVLGVFVITVVFAPSLLKRYSGILNFSLINGLKVYFSRLFGNGSYASLLMIGLLNGILPCGLVYLALAGGMATGGIISGALFVASFGLGTLPVMLAVSMGGAFAGQALKTKIRKTVPVMMVCMGMVLILRGMNLGIPYVSPKVGTEGQEIHSCH
ncbi:MAG: sulfite exporter TauE/SafE family protein [Cytophagaceae bacterium]